MTAKEYLSQVQKLNILIDQRREERNALRRFDGLSAVDCSAQRVQTSAKQDAAFVKTVEKIILLEDKIDKLINSYVDLKNRIIGQIHDLNNPLYIQILYKRYIEFKSLFKIAAELNYSYDRIRHLHGRALKTFGKKFLQK